MSSAAATLWDHLRGRAEPERAWELFHENSKTSRFEALPPEEMILAKMARLWESLPFPQYPAVALPPDPPPLDMSLSEVVQARRSTQALEPRPLALGAVAAILRHGYGVTADNQDGNFPRPFRAVPSGGALFPLEIFFHASAVEGLDPGLYHYNPTLDELRLLRPSDARDHIANAVIQPDVIRTAPLVLFITAMFERSVFKYGDRGYRFVLLEAGHVSQNMILASTALGLGYLPMGGYFDRTIDELLGLDGLNQSTIYMAAIGHKADRPTD